MELIFLMGLPGAGKTYYANEYKREHENVIIVSSDDIRQELWGDANDQQNPAAVFDEMHARTVAALKEDKTVIYDATNLVAKTRKNTLTKIRRELRAEAGEFEAHLVFVSCSVSECKRRQQDRERKVPDEVIDRMIRQFHAPWFNEGWDVITRVEGGRPQNIAKEHDRLINESHDNYHHEYSIGLHCTLCASKMKQLLADRSMNTMYKLALIEAAYQHDIGKKKTKAFVNSKGEPDDQAHYYNHDNVGAYLWLSGNEAQYWSDGMFFFIGVLIQWHMQPYMMRDNEAEFGKWCEKHGFSGDLFKSLWLLHEADKAAH